MKIFKQFISVFIVTGLILTQSVYAQFVASYDQAVITIIQIEDNEKIVAANGTVFKITLPDVLKDAKALKKQQVRVLYIVMGEKKTIIDIKPASEPLFIISKKVLGSKAMGVLK